jgi:hypothetical protein
MLAELMIQNEAGILIERGERKVGSEDSCLFLQDMAGGMKA